MAETQEQWYNRQAIEQLAQHIPFEHDLSCKSELIEMLRGLVIHHGRDMDPDLFGFEAHCELFVWDCGAVSVIVGIKVNDEKNDRDYRLLEWIWS